jgi:O-antigen/teichoic acid export membrane protein
VPTDHPKDERGDAIPVRARRRLAAGAWAALFGQLAAVAGGLVTSVYIANAFGPDGTGAYALVGSLFAALFLLAGLGLPTGITFLVSRRVWSATAALWESTGAALPLGVAGMGLGMGFYALTNDSILDGVTLPEALAVCGAVPFGIVWLNCGAIALALDLYEQYASFQLSRAILSLVAVVGLGIGFGLAGAIIGFAIGQALSALLAATSLLRSVPDAGEETRAHETRHGLTPLRSALKFGRRAWSADVLQFLNYRLDLFILAAFVSRADVGRYSLAVSLTMLAWLLPTAIGQVLLPRTASLDSAAEIGEMRRDEADAAAARVIRHTVLLQGPTAVVISILLLGGVPLIYGHEFTQTVALGFLLLPGVLAASVAKVVSPVITGRGFPIYSVYNVLITVPVTLILYLTMIPLLDAAGAAIASSASYALTTIIAMYFYRRVTRSSLRSVLVPTVADLQEYPITASRFLSSGRARLAARRNCASS